VTPEGLEAWQRAYINHRIRVRAEERRWMAECITLQDQYGYPHGQLGPHLTRKGSPMYQAALDELNPPATGDQAAFSTPGGTWFAADAAAYLPPCEMEE
jgi:hypothetical protein